MRGMEGIFFSLMMRGIRYGLFIGMNALYLGGCNGGAFFWIFLVNSYVN
jgi:hypothetical protein